MKITILGPGCPNCQRLRVNVDQALSDLDLKDVKMEHISDMNEIIDKGVTSTPAILIDEDVKAVGRVPEVDEIRSWLK